MGGFHTPVVDPAKNQSLDRVKQVYHYHVYYSHILITPPKINIEPENGGLEDDFPFPGVYSQVPC